MGSTCSNESIQENVETFETAKQRANKIYNYRMKHYSPLLHGPRDYYMLQVEAEYELECIPEYMRRGSQYSGW